MKMECFFGETNPTDLQCPKDIPLPMKWMQGREMRRTKYIGEKKVHFQNTMTAAAINLYRAIRWLVGIPSAETYMSPFAILGI